MGRDKAAIEWSRETLLTHALKRMRAAFPKVIVLGPSVSDGSPNLTDEFPNCGPLGGIHSALRRSQTDWNLFLAVDMPLVSPALLQFIATKCDLSDLAVVPQVTRSDLDASNLEGKSASNQTFDLLQPLCAAYHRGILPLVERALSNRELSIRRLLEQAAQGMMGRRGDAIRIIQEHELISAGFDPTMLINVNTPADLECAKSFAEHFHVE